MRDEDKPYICYKQGWNMKIVPRNGSGWKALGLWMLPILLVSGLFVWATVYMASNGWAETRTPLLVAAGFFLFIAIWSVSMIRWMMARSEIVDVDGILEIKREQERQAKKRGRM